MSDLKFSCPSCAQHIRCDESCAGEKLPCPACGSLVRVPVDAPIATKATVAAMTPAPVQTGAANVPTLEENFLQEPGVPLPTTPPMTKREQKIAAARAAHPMQPNPAVKPRLSYILSGGEAPVPAENQTASGHGEQKPDDDSGTKTLRE